MKVKQLKKSMFINKTLTSYGTHFETVSCNIIKNLYTYANNVYKETDTQRNRSNNRADYSQNNFRCDKRVSISCALRESS